MPVKPITTEFGHSLPPEGKHNITIHGKSWDSAIRFREGDKELMAKVRSVYPRFMPFSDARQLLAAIATKLELPEGTGAIAFVSPDVFPAAKRFSTSEHRKEHKLAESDLMFRVVEINRIKLYIIAYSAAKTRGIIGVWQHPGIGISTRLAEELLPHKDSIECLPFKGEEDMSNVPAPSYLPETESHVQVKERITELLHRGAINSGKAKVTSDDIYLYPSGMAAIYRSNQTLLDVFPGKIVVLGAVFHSSWHLFEETADGAKQFGQCDASSNVVDELESFIKEEANAGRKISYVFTEFPSNPILVSVDLKKLRALADKYDFAVIVDDTIGSFCNIDLLPVADMIITSLTKSFSGYANVLGGSAILNPASPQYSRLKPAFVSAFHNELFAGDAAMLLSNSENYLSRSAILNRNALALAERMQKEVSNSASPVQKVLYPPMSDTAENYAAFMRKPTADFTPGHGCLLSVDFEDLASAIAFYDNLEVHQGPHLGAHLSLALPYNAITYGGDAKEAEYHASYGLREPQVRISVGLENVEDLLQTLEAALAKAEEAKEAKGANNS